MIKSQGLMELDGAGEAKCCKPADCNHLDMAASVDSPVCESEKVPPWWSWCDGQLDCWTCPPMTKIPESLVMKKVFRDNPFNAAIHYKENVRLWKSIQHLKSDNLKSNQNLYNKDNCSKNNFQSIGWTLYETVMESKSMQQLRGGKEICFQKVLKTSTRKMFLSRKTLKFINIKKASGMFHALESIKRMQVNKNMPNCSFANPGTLRIFKLLRTKKSLWLHWAWQI